jgi:hypothetical protein
MTQQIKTSLPDDLANQVRAQASESMISTSAVVRKAVKKYFKGGTSKDRAAAQGGDKRRHPAPG